MRFVQSSFLLACVLCFHETAILQAADPKASPPPEPPKLLVTVPVGLNAGRTNVVMLRGLRLKEATNVVLGGWSRPLPASIRKREDSKPPDGLTPARAGDQLLEVEILIPIEAGGATNLMWTIRGTNGAESLGGVPVLAEGTSTEARKPNGGFAEAQPVKLGQTVRGTLEKNGDVDVFRLEAAAGVRLHAEIRASRIGSTLDAILTVYDERGAVLVSNDDTWDQDPSVDFPVPAAGPFFVVVTYANEKAAKTHGYLLRVEAVK